LKDILSNNEKDIIQDPKYKTALTNLVCFFIYLPFLLIFIKFRALIMLKQTLKKNIIMLDLLNKLVLNIMKSSV
jgi:hypothetical protein